MPLSIQAVRDDPQDCTPHVVHVARALCGAALQGGGGSMNDGGGVYGAAALQCCRLNYRQ
jgi:hypothetical protein